MHAQIKEKRIENKMMQKDLAVELGVDRSTVAKWESGEATPRTANLIALARLFGCTVDELLITE